MITLLSPAKNLNFDPVKDVPRATRPGLLKDTKELSGVTIDLSRADLKRLMGISDNLADLNYQRFQALQATGTGRGTKHAALAFNGDVYLGLDANTLSTDDLEFAQDHLRILSGLYGILRPLDAIEPYRLEMGTRLKNPRGRNLYEFWGDKVSGTLNKALREHDEKTIINLASNEYFSVVDKKMLSAQIITPVFKEEKDGKLRQLQFYAKRARGLMARYAIENRIEKAADLKAFSVDKYRFDPQGSTEDTWLFTRPQPAPVGAKPKAKTSTKTVAKKRAKRAKTA